MSGRKPDHDTTIRDWLLDASPNGLPAGLRESLDRILSEPPDDAAAQRWTPRSRRAPWSGRLTRVAAVAAAIAIMGTIALVGSSPQVAVPSSTATPTSTPTATTTPPSSPTARVTRFAGSTWAQVEGGLPKLSVGDQWVTPPCPVYARPGGGFVAFVASSAGAATGGRLTQVLSSPDGIAWTTLSALPTENATVADLAEANGVFVAVGWEGPQPPQGGRAEIWTSRDLRTWDAADVSRPDGAPVSHVIRGSAGFLAWGVNNSETFPYDFWISKDGFRWETATVSGLPKDLGSGGGLELRVLGNNYVIYSGVGVWQSMDGASWSKAWAYTGTGAAPKAEGDAFVAFGPVFSAGSGGFVSFGQSGVVSGGPAPGPEHILTWTSADGVRWVPGRTNSFGVNLAFAPSSQGFIAAGAQPPSGDDSGTPWGKLAAWRTADGQSWTSVGDLPQVGSVLGSSTVSVLGVVGDGAHVVIVCLEAAGPVPAAAGWQDGKLLLVVGQ